MITIKKPWILCSTLLLLLLFADLLTAQNSNEENGFNTTKEPFKWPKRCLVCNSVDDSNCDNWFGYDYIRTCDKKHGVDPNKPITCRKITQSLHKEVRVIRQCSNEQVPTGCIDRVGTNKIKMRYCHCNDRDECNMAVRKVSDFHLSLLVPLLAGVVLILYTSA